jgi:hypothetical protein
MRRFSHLIVGVALVSCAAPVPTSSNPGIIMAPDKYVLEMGTATGSNGNYQTVTLSFLVLDPHTLTHIGGAVVHLRATRGFFTPAPRMIADSDGRTTIVWSESFPILRPDTVFTCSVDAGYDCYPTYPSFIVGPSSGI